MAKNILNSGIFGPPISTSIIAVSSKDSVTRNNDTENNNVPDTTNSKPRSSTSFNTTDGPIESHNDTTTDVCTSIDAAIVSLSINDSASGASSEQAAKSSTVATTVNGNSEVTGAFTSIDGAIEFQSINNSKFAPESSNRSEPSIVTTDGTVTSIEASIGSLSSNDSTSGSNRALKSSTATKTDNVKRNISIPCTSIEDVLGSLSINESESMASSNAATIPIINTKSATDKSSTSAKNDGTEKPSSTTISNRNNKLFGFSTSSGPVFGSPIRISDSMLSITSRSEANVSNTTTTIKTQNGMFGPSTVAGPVYDLTDSSDDLEADSDTIQTSKAITANIAYATPATTSSETRSTVDSTSDCTPTTTETNTSKSSGQEKVINGSGSGASLSNSGQTSGLSNNDIVTTKSKSSSVSTNTNSIVTTTTDTNITSIETNIGSLSINDSTNGSNGVPKSLTDVKRNISIPSTSIDDAIGYLSINDSSSNEAAKPITSTISATNNSSTSANNDGTANSIGRSSSVPTNTNSVVTTTAAMSDEVFRGGEPISGGPRSSSLLTGTANTTSTTGSDRPTTETAETISASDEVFRFGETSRPVEFRFKFETAKRSTAIIRYPITISTTRTVARRRFAKSSTEVLIQISNDFTEDHTLRIVRDFITKVKRPAEGSLAGTSNTVTYNSTIDASKSTTSSNSIASTSTGGTTNAAISGGSTTETSVTNATTDKVFRFGQTSKPAENRIDFETEEEDSSSGTSNATRSDRVYFTDKDTIELVRAFIEKIKPSTHDPLKITTNTEGNTSNSGVSVGSSTGGTTSTITHSSTIGACGRISPTTSGSTISTNCDARVTSNTPNEPATLSTIVTSQELSLSTSPSQVTTISSQRSTSSSQETIGSSHATAGSSQEPNIPNLEEAVSSLETTFSGLRIGVMGQPSLSSKPDNKENTVSQQEHAQETNTSTQESDISVYEEDRELQTTGNSLEEVVKTIESLKDLVLTIKINLESQMQSLGRTFEDRLSIIEKQVESLNKKMSKEDGNNQILKNAVNTQSYEENINDGPSTSRNDQLYYTPNVSHNVQGTNVNAPSARHNVQSTNDNA